MGKWLLAESIAFFGATVVMSDADAARLGAGRSMGAQRSVTAPPAQTPAKPGQQQAAPAGQQQNPQTAAAGNRWLPILGGLAVGGLLGYLFRGNGLLRIVLLALLAFGAVLAVRALARRGRQAPQPMEYAGMRRGMERETIRAPQAVEAQP